RSFIQKFSPYIQDYDLAPAPTVSFPLLAEGQTKAGRAFYYRVSPCPERELVEVRPWWSADPVLVCRDDYRPKARQARDGRHCDQVKDPFNRDAGCGCGPYLMDCGPPEQRGRIREAHHDELDLTMKHVIESDRPFSDLLTMNGSVRSGWADLYYARIEYFRTGEFVPPEVNQPATLRPRVGPAAGGIL